MLFILSAILIQGCKKDATTSATSISDKILSATINGLAWIPDTVDATITYNSATKQKVFSIGGTTDLKRVIMSVTLNNATNANDFIIDTYKIDSTSKVKFALYADTANVNNYVQVGEVDSGSGTISITAIDTVKNLITGTYDFTAKKVNYDADGNYISVEISQVLSGTFTNTPYIFKSN